MPDGAKTVKQFRLPRLLPLFLAFLFVCCAILLSWIIRDYQATRSQMYRLAQLQRENEEQKRQFVQLAGRILQLPQPMDELQKGDPELMAMVDQEASQEDTRLQGIGGSDPNPLPTDSTTVKTHQGFVRLMNLCLDHLNHKMAVIKHDRLEVQRFFEDQKIRLSHTPSIWPAKGWLSSRFGYRRSPFTGKKEFHNGIDICTRMAAPIVAPADGTVTSICREHLSGNLLYINHGYGLVTKYAHLQKALVRKGERVKRGERIGLVGSSGRSTGPHLHYEIHLNGVPVNPLRYISD